MDIVITIAAITAIASLATLGLLALPWTDAELTQTTEALRATPALAARPGATQANPHLTLA